METHTRSAFGTVILDTEQLRFELHHLSAVRRATALVEIDLDFGKHLRRCEFADVVEVTLAPCSLHPDEGNLGAAQERFGVEIGRYGQGRC